MTFALLLAIASVTAGVVASVAGFGIGSLLTPVFAHRLDTRLAVAAVSIPHLVATSVRLWTMRAHVDLQLLRGFGAASAAGGLLGALLHARLTSRSLAIVFGLLLLFAGFAELVGLARRLRFGGRAAWVAGVVSGVFGGLVGNQGGIRSAALLGLDVPRLAFVATATATALAVDLARMPVYLVVEGERLGPFWPLIALSSAGAVAGTIVGTRWLPRIPEAAFRRTVAIALIALGVFMLARGVGTVA